MKQLEMTPALSAMIKNAVGEDVDTAQLAVFETILLNTRPLPGKRGTIFEQAKVSPTTLIQMAEHINSGNHLPLIADHQLSGEPKGRVFHAGTDYTNGELELRGLFYIDPSEQQLLVKLNSGVLDEVSIAILSKALLCSACGWDYFGEQASREALYDRTCANGHAIGKNGTHVVMEGLNQFIETSLVARGAAEKPKIVGKSQAKLAPPPLQQLAANGFKVDDVVLLASINEKDEVDMDLTAALTQIATLSEDKGKITAQLHAAAAEKTALDGKVAALTTERDAALAQVTTLTTERDAALADAKNADVAELTAAKDLLKSQLNRLRVASGKAELKAEELPDTVAALNTAIDEITLGLTALLPTGGVAAGAASGDAEAKSRDLKAAYAVDAR